MKLRNKKTGEIVKFETTIYADTEDKTYEFNSIAELNDEWEDYEEPSKTIWQIKDSGELQDFEEDDFSDGYIESSKSIGNYFYTREEAEQAVEKLKAAKRLKDKGLTFCAWKITDDGCSVDVETTLDAEIVRAEQKYITDDLNLLFGGNDESSN